MEILRLDLTANIANKIENCVKALGNGEYYHVVMIVFKMRLFLEICIFWNF